MNCNELESMLIDYLEGDLKAARVEEMLNHLEQCESCRRVFQAYQEQDEHLHRYYKIQAERMPAPQNPLTSPRVEDRARPSRYSFKQWAWAAAALILIALGLGTWSVYLRNVATGHDVLAKIKEADGRVLVRESSSYQAAAAGAPLRQSQMLKVAEGGYASLAFPDGNILEVRGGTQLALQDFPDRFEVVMNRGQVWAHLNIKPRKRFVIRTAHLTATAVGTVYGVDEGLDRSVVAVARGTVKVENGKAAEQVEKGNIYSSRLNIDVAGLMAKSIAWSRLPEDLASLVPENGSSVGSPVTPLKKESASSDTANQQESQSAPTKAAQASMAVPQGAISDLADLLPSDTRYFLVMRDWPNVIKQFHDSDYSALTSEPAIRRWWETIHGQQYLKEFMSEVHLLDLLDIAKLLDGQVVVGVTGSKNDFIFLADCRTHEAELSGRLEKLLATQDASTVTPPALNIQPNSYPNQPPPGSLEELRKHVFITQGRLIVSSNPVVASEACDRLQSGRSTEFTSSDFYKKILSNAGQSPFMMAASLADAFAEKPGASPSGDPKLNFLGVRGLDYLLIAPSFAGRGMNQAARVGFRDKRFGVMNWLGEPAPMRGFDFFSPEVHFFTSAIVRSPRQILFDILLLKYSSGQRADEQRTRDFFDQHEPFFSALGNEVAIGIENPILPIPNVKIAVEVLDQPAAEHQLNQFVQEFIQAQEQQGKFSYRDAITCKGYNVHSLVIDGLPFVPSWAFVDDFMIMGPGPQFVSSSIEVYVSKLSIGHDPHLTSLLPKSASTNFSLLVYQDIAKTIPQLLKNTMLPKLGQQESGLVPDLSFMERYRAPGIAYACAWPSYIDLYFNTPSGIDFNMGLAIPAVANWLGPLTNIGKTIDKYAETVVQLEKLQEAAGKFKEEKGRLPESLTELAHPVGRYIDQIPADPFAQNSSETLRLIKGEKPGEIVFYSVGPDGVDQQGGLVLDPDKDVNGPGDIVIRLPKAEGAAVSP